MDSVAVIFISFFAVSMGIYHAFNIYLNIKTRKKETAFFKKSAEQMEKMKSQLEQRAINLQESVDMVSKEYNDLMKEVLVNPKLSEFKKNLKDHKGPKKKPLRKRPLPEEPSDH